MKGVAVVYLKDMKSYIASEFIVLEIFCKYTNTRAHRGFLILKNTHFWKFQYIFDVIVYGKNI